MLHVNHLPNKTTTKSVEKLKKRNRELWDVRSHYRPTYTGKRQELPNTKSRHRWCACAALMHNITSTSASTSPTLGSFQQWLAADWRATCCFHMIFQSPCSLLSQWTLPTDRYFPLASSPQLAGLKFPSRLPQNAATAALKDSHRSRTISYAWCCPLASTLAEVHVLCGFLFWSEGKGQMVFQAIPWLHVESWRKNSNIHTVLKKRRLQHPHYVKRTYAACVLQGPLCKPLWNAYNKLETEKNNKIKNPPVGLPSSDRLLAWI